MLKESLTLPDGTIIQGGNRARYVVEQLLGTGGFSAVYRVRDRSDRDKVFALKEIIDPYHKERRHLAIEAELLTRLQHPSLPNVYQVFADPKHNRVYMVMDYVQGKDLETLRREQPGKRFSLALALTLMTAIVEAVSYLHSQDPPVIHRDIKPSNIIVPTGSGSPYLVDFGLAKEYVADKTTNVLRYGTPGYAAPEQYGQGTNLRTDIYALGATFYTLLTGTVPADALTRSLEKEHGDPLLLANQVCPAIPASVARVLKQAMSLRSEDRFESVYEFWQALSLAVIKHTQEPQHSPLTPVPLFLASRDITRHSTTTSPKRRSSQRKQYRVSIRLPSQRSRPKMLLLVLLVLLLIAVATDAVLFFTVWSSPRQATDVSSHRTSSQKATNVTNAAFAGCPQKTFSTPAVSGPSSYPVLASCYQGTINNTGVSHQKTDMYLWDIHQEQDKISGKFSGLGMVGTFSGIITADSQMKFIVQLPGKKLSFQGTNYLSRLVFIFHGLDQNNQPTDDEYGNCELLNGANADQSAAIPAS